MLVTAMMRTRGASGDRAGLAQHLADVGEMRLFGGDLGARVLFQHDAAVRDLLEELAVLGEALLLVDQRLAQDLIHVVLVSLEQRADLERRVTTEVGDLLARLYRVRLRLVGLSAQPADDRDTVVAEYHETVVQVANQSRELELEDAVEGLDDLDGVGLAEPGSHALV